MLAARFAPEALVCEQENATETIGQNGNEPEREKAGRPVRVGALPSKLPAGIPGRRLLAGRVLSVRHDRWVGADTRAAPNARARS
jgi:hypothetical protein